MHRYTYSIIRKHDTVDIVEEHLFEHLQDALIAYESRRKSLRKLQCDMYDERDSYGLHQLVVHVEKIRHMISVQ